MIDNVNDKLNRIEASCKKVMKQIDDIALINQEKVLSAFQKEKIALAHFAPSSGYGYDDVGRPKLCALYADIFKAEKAFISPLITCGTHAIFLALRGALCPGDLAISITGQPYDTLLDCLYGKNVGSLADDGIKFKTIPMLGSKINISKVLKVIAEKRPKMVYVQRSRGYSKRKTLTIEYLEEVFKEIRKVCPKTIIMVDNCYGEFVSTREPIEIGADIIAGSLIKNIGGGLAPTGGYIAGRADLVDASVRRLTAPSLGDEVGSYNATYTPFFEGLFIAPHVVGGALKGNVLLGKTAKVCGFKTSPEPNHVPEDIIRTITFNNKQKFLDFVQSIQSLSPVDSYLVLEPYKMPGYNDNIIMASGSFVQGSSIEFSCDGPVKPPYIAYMQGGITYEHIKLVARNLLAKNLQK